MSRIKLTTRPHALALVLVCVAMSIPSQTLSGQRSGVEVWSANCGRCHTIQSPDRYYAKDWASIAIHMAITARLTGSEADAVTRFLLSGARMGEEGEGQSAPPVLSGGFATLASVSQVVTQPEQVYKQRCAPCHGEEGHGDGPAAMAFNPRPGDFDDKAFWAERSNVQIDSVITAGKGSMPPLGNTLEPEVREALIKYLRTKFSGGSAKKADGS